MSGHGQKFERRTETAIAALLIQPTIGEAAKVAGVSEATLRRWLHQPSFVKRYRAAKTEVVRAATKRLRNLFDAAVVNLGNIMLDRTAPFSVRVRASQAIAELALRAHEAEDIGERLSLLEATISGGDQ